MRKEWYLLINNKPEGPYDVEELRELSLMTPDTLAWREGMDRWEPAGGIKELQSVWEDRGDPEGPKVIDFSSRSLNENNDIIAMNYDPCQWFFWLLLIILIFLYVLYKLG